MKLTQLTMAIGLALVLILGFTACEEPEEDADDGTISVKVDGAASYNNEPFIAAVFPAGAEKNESNVLGYTQDDTFISSGTATATTKTEAGALFVGSGDTAYDVIAWIDINEDGQPNTGDYLYEGRVVIDGNVTITTTYPGDYEQQ